MLKNLKKCNAKCRHGKIPQDMMERVVKVQLGTSDKQPKRPVDQEVGALDEY